MFLSEISDSLELVRRLKKPQHVRELGLRWKNPEAKVVAFDLDETLVHCPSVSAFMRDQSQINIRPFAQYCLHEVSQFCEVIVFTAAQRDYADRAIDLLDPTRTLVTHRLYREHCTEAHGV